MITMYENNKYIKSPIFYMGNKYDLLYELLPRFPKEDEVETFIDLFGGSGTVSLNVPYKNIIYNELNHNIVDLLNMFKIYNSEEIIKHIEKRVIDFELPTKTTDLRCVDKELREKENKNYLNFRRFYNKQENKSLLDLYTLTFYSFCNCIRFNSKNEFNMPFGNRCILDVHKQQIKECCESLQNKNINIYNKNAFNILNNIKEYNDRLFIYLDPPYSNTMAIYNESRAFGGWTIEEDNKLFAELDRLHKLGVKWCMSNVLENKGKFNNHIQEWANENGYEIIYLEDKTYSTFGTGNSNSKEIMVVNYETPFKKFNIFDFID